MRKRYDSDGLEKSCNYCIKINRVFFIPSVFQHWSINMHPLPGQSIPRPARKERTSSMIRTLTQCFKLWATSSWSGATPLWGWFVIYVEMICNDFFWFDHKSLGSGTVRVIPTPESPIWFCITIQPPVLEVRAMRLFRLGDGRSRGPAICKVHLKTWSEVWVKGFVSTSKEVRSYFRTKQGMKSEASGLLRQAPKWCRAYLNVWMSCPYVGLLELKGFRSRHPWFCFRVSEWCLEKSCHLSLMYHLAPKTSLTWGSLMSYKSFYLHVLVRLVCTDMQRLFGLNSSLFVFQGWAMQSASIFLLCFSLVWRPRALSIHQLRRSKQGWWWMEMRVICDGHVTFWHLGDSKVNQAESKIW